MKKYLYWFISIFVTKNLNSYKRLVFIFALLCVLAQQTVLAQGESCSAKPISVVGKIYCDNKFTLWVNGKKVAEDPIDFTPHQALEVSFEWNASSNITYAIMCEDYASPSGYEYTERKRPQLGDGALIAEFEDGLGTVTSSDWKVYTVTYGPTTQSIEAGCSGQNLSACMLENRGIPKDWTMADFDDSHWLPASTYTAQAAGWGRTPSWDTDNGCCTVTSPLNGESLGCKMLSDERACLAPKQVFKESSAEFIWAASLEKDNKVLFRYTAEQNCSIE